MPHARGVVKGMALEYIRFGALTLPMGLTELELYTIANEVRTWQGQSYDEPALWRAAPQLTQFIDRHRGKDSENSRLAHLENMIRVLDTIVDAGERYMEHVRALYAVFEPLLKSPEKEPSADEDELLALIREQQEAQESERAKRHGNTKPKVMDEEEVRKSTAKKIKSLMHQCQVFVRLYFDSQDAKRIYAQYQETHALLLKAVALPSAEAEQLMRYQTNLERRLSLAIGELLELRRRAL